MCSYLTEGGTNGKPEKVEFGVRLPPNRRDRINTVSDVGSVCVCLCVCVVYLGRWG